MDAVLHGDRDELHHHLYAPEDRVLQGHYGILPWRRSRADAEGMGLLAACHRLFCHKLAPVMVPLQEENLPESLIFVNYFFISSEKVLPL